MTFVCVGSPNERLSMVRCCTSGLATRAILLASVAAISLPAAAQPTATARPQGGQVVAGAAQISRTDAVTRIDQSSQRAAIDWRSFDVDSGQQVQFQQPSANAVTLNRVTSADPSQIAGKITANGQVVVVNQSGVLFTKGAQVNAQSVVVSAAGITNQNFMAGRMVFDQPARPDAQIVNEGRITVKQAGLAALVAPQVKNAGMISAKLGHVILGGAETHTLDLYGDGLLSFDVTGQVRQAPVDKYGKTQTTLVTNTGAIQADGGTVLLTALAVDGVVQNLVTAGGKISASSVGDKTGTIVLGGTGGSLMVAGTLTADGHAPGTTGGQIQVASTGDAMVAAGARVDASGRAGGGTVAIGTTLARAKGGPSVSPSVLARNTTIKKGATVSADATQYGRGGNVTVLSANATQHNGAITARGGPQSGNGGTVEMSGQTLGLVGTTYADARAPYGAPGSILLDPAKITIVHGGSGTSDGALPVVDLAPTSYVNATVSDTAINLSGVNNNITISAANVAVNGTVVINIPKTITLLADETVFVSNGASITANGITIDSRTVSTANTLAVTSSGILHANNVLLGGTVTIPGGSVTGTNTVTIHGGNLDLASSISAGTVVLDLAGNATEAAGGSITTNLLRGSANGVTFDGPNKIGTLGQLSVSGTDVRLTNAKSLTVAGPITTVPNASDGIASSVQLSVTGDLILGGTGSLAVLSAPSFASQLAGPGLSNIFGTVALSATGQITEPNGSIRSGNLKVSAANANLNGANIVDTLTSVNAGIGNFTLADQPGTPLTVNVPGGVMVTGNNALLSLRATSLAINSSLTAPGAAATIALTADSITVGGGARATSGGTVQVGPLSSGLAVDVSGQSAAGVTLGLANVTGQIFAPTLQIGGGSGGPTVAAITFSQTFSRPGHLDLETTGTITQQQPITVGFLTGSAGSVLLDTPGNNISQIGSLLVQNSLSIAQAPALTIAGGSVTAGGSIFLSANDGIAIGNGLSAGQFVAANGSPVELVSTGSITEPNGSIIASALNAVSTSGSVQLGGANVIGALQAGPVRGDQGLNDVAAGTFSLTNTQSLTIAKEIGAFGGVTLNIAGDLTLGTPQSRGVVFAQGPINLNVAGDVTAPNGLISAFGAILSGSSRSLSLTGLPQFLGTLGNYTAPNGIAITTAGDLVLNGDIATPSLHIDANGAITRVGGTLTVGTVSGSALHLADFGTNAQISTLGAFSVTGSEFALSTNVPLTITGPLSAEFIRIHAPGQVTLNGTIATQGVPLARQSGAQPADPSSYIDVLPATSSTGNLVSRFVETGNAAIVPLGASTATLRISAQGTGGQIAFGTLSAPHVFLVLDTGTGGRSSGTVIVDGLLVLGTGGDARLFGSIGGVGGFEASAEARIDPRIDAAYTMNGCIIGASCNLVISAQNLPQVYTVLSDARATSPLSPLVLVAVPQFPVPLGWMSSPDVVPPNIAGPDY
jgi:filamentous hemagglutinin family protein